MCYKSVSNADVNHGKGKKMQKVYTVLKDGNVEYVGYDYKIAIKIAEEVSGLDLQIPLATVDVWEATLNTKETKIIWSCSWEQLGPLEPNIFASLPFSE